MDYNLRKRIERIAGTLYGQITSEADMVYGEWMLERGKEVSIHLPENSTEEEVESAVLVVFQALKWHHGTYGFRVADGLVTCFRATFISAVVHDDGHVTFSPVEDDTE